jgi:predicted RNA-binding Zn-ribbon protein involved in translation (DUF1610 family)
MIYTNLAVSFFKQISDHNVLKDKSKEIAIRCPKCGDSKKSISKARLYISKENPMFICFNCGYSGSILKLFSDNNKELNQNNYKKYINIDNLSFQYKDKDYYSKKNELDINEVNNEIQSYQIEYLFNRFGKFDLNKFNFLKDKLIFNIDYIWNHITNNYNGHNGWLYTTYNQIKNNSIGFISHNNNKVGFRLINGDKRYINMSLNSGEYFSDYFAFFKENYNIEYGKPLNVVIAEGAFDILNIYLKELEDADFYIAAQSNNYNQIMKFLLTNTNKYYFNLNFYIDQDFDDKVLKYFYNDNNKYIDSMRIYFNSEGKDFGEGQLNKRILKKF